MRSRQTIPRFESEQEERAFWATHAMTDYMQEISGDVTFPKLQPSTETISLRLPLGLLDQIKVEAHKRDVPYQSFIKLKLGEILGRTT